MASDHRYRHVRDHTERYLQLPGNVLLTLRASGKVYSLPNIHGDIFATTDAVGTITGTYQTDPFGEIATGQAKPGNTVLGATYAYVGQHEKLTETDFTIQLTQMGARVYLPSIGRFLQVDPVEGGTPNSYVYVVDSVNDFDLSGEFGLKDIWTGAGRAVSFGYKQLTNLWAWEDAHPRLTLVLTSLMPGEEGVRFKSIRSYKSARETMPIGVKGYTRTTWSINARNVGGPARAVMVKIKNAAGKTIRVYKDTYNRDNKFMHRKYKL